MWLSTPTTVWLLALVSSTVDQWAEGCLQILLCSMTGTLCSGPCQLSTQFDLSVTLQLEHSFHFVALKSDQYTEYLLKEN